MHRQFAGILGSAAFVIAVLRGWSQGGDPTVVFPQAVAFLIVFTIAGAAAGRIALWMVEEGVTAQLRDALAERSKK